MNSTWRVIVFLIILWRICYNNNLLVHGCPLECICLSQTQVMCNTGALREIPLKAIPVTVEQLSLTKNYFPIIKSDAFGGLRALRKLSLDGNNITTIKPFAFRGLPRLRDLSIQHTPLATVASFAFAGLQNVSQIQLSHNKILRIEGYAFAGAVNVRQIHLADNPTVTIETNAFSSLSNVDRLILPSGIRVIEPDAFYGLETVGYLKLSFMDLASLEPYTFRGLTHVKLLSLQESDLGIIRAGAFEGLVQVELLNILNNKIDAIQELNITAANRIKVLRIQGNHLLETPESGSIVLEGIDTLHVNSNYFPCGCHIHTLLDSPLSNGTYLSHSGAPAGDFLSKNYCISPLEVNGMPMSSIDIYSIGRCLEQVTRENLEAANSVISTMLRGQSWNRWLQWQSEHSKRSQETTLISAVSSAVRFLAASPIIAIKFVVYLQNFNIKIS
ncbi:leucine-rich repeat-containing protein 4B [Anopheles gambiae]|uniref:leucine-rich repeat-containing protein 4B n=1 Tax=Anopheles gambiae TaxID=7165 RepID=UPI002AC9F04D|nr:leucine-rich repeat-containing protein 4B [Anopheles gambiae]XP_061502151.1 leucine-rich repeat-containing protein 4B [Anopheles gambiae]XP_061502152.1 leucine-rich repeat-containing protein 4B [Anopheles gambiae]XP_061502153.1 leucine-rich repeat-containing protein 4B [Anopheles gambiae]XP_061502154.1 leucine-rich repeat-containing protein 4B [Anopheles gambiae]XP_061502155.1 leucine-rich repeat-containing protein 4B [Anopheles gambiae]XP_308104.6 leucine-rich repeat-containing protein 4B